MNDNEAHELSEALTKYLEEHRLSIAEFGRRYGLAENTVAKVKSGGGGSRRTVETVRRALGGPPVTELLVSQRETLPADVLLAQEIVAMWLLGMPEEQRKNAAERLLLLVREAQAD